MRVGDVDLLDWDISAWKVIGAKLDEVKNELYFPLGFMTTIKNPNPELDDDVEVDYARVLFKKPEPTHFEFDLPLIAISRDDISPATDRIYPVTESYRVPAEGATRVSTCGVLGWSHYETKPQEEPLDFTYTYEAWARDRVIAQQMFVMLMAKLPPLRGKMTVVDSLECARVYSFGMESTADLTEVSSLVDRIPGFSISIRVKGELTLDLSAIVTNAITGTLSDTPSDPDDPDPGQGGMYGNDPLNITIIPPALGKGVLSPSVGVSPGVYDFEVNGPLVRHMGYRLKDSRALRGYYSFKGNKP